MNAKYKELHQNVIKWAAERGLLHDVTIERIDKQCDKVLEEVGETCGAMLKNKPLEIKDGIGDVQVTLILHAKMRGIVINIDLMESIIESYQSGGTKFKMKDVLYWFFNHNYEVALAMLYMVATDLGYGFTDCLESAYNEIKDRKGQLIGNTFIKEEV